jgi:hypothetical protein
MFNFHKHNYLVLDKIETKSEAEQLSEMGLRPNTHSNYHKQYITILKCSICGKIKTIKISS